MEYLFAVICQLIYWRHLLIR